MMRVNGEESRAMVESLGVGFESGLAALVFQIAVPTDELVRWTVGSYVSLAARWQFEFAPFPAHTVVTDVMESKSVQGQFLIRERYPVGTGGWCLMTLESSGVVTPLEPPR